MYDILQLNDMLVPELLDIAEQLKIPNAKKLAKQDLVYKILDGQAIAGSKGAKPAEDGKRKRIIKVTTSSGSEEAEVDNPPPAPVREDKIIIKKPNMPVKKDDKAPIKRARKKDRRQRNNYRKQRTGN
jgi:transcription termination factor Rho